MGSAAMVRARRSRPRRDVVLPRAVVRAAVGAGVVLVAGAFAIGVRVGASGAIAPQPASPSVSPSVSPMSASPVLLVTPTRSSTRAATVAPSAVEAPTPRVVAPPSPVPALGVPPTKGYGLQLGAFERDDEARAFIRDHLTSSGGLPVFLVETRIDDRTWYRVRLGEASTRAAAEALRHALAPALRDRAIVVSHK